MYKTLTNQNDEIYVTDMNEMLTLDVLTKTDLDLALENYLPLTAGSSKKLTGDLYLDNNKFIKAYTTASTLRNLIGVNSSSTIELGDTSANINVKAASAFRPASNNATGLGTSALQWKEIYGTTIYQNGKEVANKEDLQNINMSDYLSKSGGTLTGTLYSKADTPLFIGYNGKVGMRAVVEGDSGHKGQINISNAWYDSQHYGAQMSAKNDETGKYNAIRVSHNGPQYEDENEVMHDIALTSDIPKFEYDATTKTLNIITE